MEEQQVKVNQQQNQEEAQESQQRSNEQAVETQAPQGQEGQRKELSPAARRIMELNARLKQAEKERDVLLATLQAQQKGNAQESTVPKDEALSETVKEEVERQLFMERLNQAAEKYPDWQEKMAIVDTVRLPEATLGEIVRSPYGADILYRIGSDVDYATRLSNMPQRNALKEVIRMELEEQLARTRNISTSKAPEPVKPITGTVIPDKDPSKMSIEEYRQWRLKQKG